MLAGAFPDGELNGGKHDANYDFADRSRCYGWGSAALAQTLRRQIVERVFQARRGTSPVQP